MVYVERPTMHIVGEPQGSELSLEVECRRRRLRPSYRPNGLSYPWGADGRGRLAGPGTESSLGNTVEGRMPASW